MAFGFGLNLGRASWALSDGAPGPMSAKSSREMPSGFEARLALATDAALGVPPEPEGAFGIDVEPDRPLLACGGPEGLPRERIERTSAADAPAILLEEIEDVVFRCCLWVAELARQNRPSWQVACRKEKAVIVISALRINCLNGPRAPTSITWTLDGTRRTFVP